MKKICAFLRYQNLSNFEINLKQLNWTPLMNMLLWYLGFIHAAFQNTHSDLALHELAPGSTCSEDGANM